jgi:hypothetical protein
MFRIFIIILIYHRHKPIELLYNLPFSEKNVPKALVPPARHLKQG